MFDKNKKELQLGDYIISTKVNRKIAQRHECLRFEQGCPIFKNRTTGREFRLDPGELYNSHYIIDK